MLKQTDGAIVRLKDVANVTLGSDDYESEVTSTARTRFTSASRWRRPPICSMSSRASARSSPTSSRSSRKGCNGEIVYDSTAFVNSSIDEVVRTLVEAVIIVTLVVFVFLGSLRSVLIPTIAIPLSLIGTFMMMLAFGFSINLLTLLALVLAIGLVVDDAIIVVENVNRHLEEGMQPFRRRSRRRASLAGRSSP